MQVVFEAIQSLDLSVLSWMRSFHSPVLVGIAVAVSFVAWKGWFWWLVVAASWLRGQKRFSVDLALGVAIATIAGLPLKGLIARPRPDLYASQQLNIPMQELLSTQHSFPSGHTLLAAVFAFVLVKYYKDYRSWLAVAFVALVGLSRIYGGYHWPSDVVGSAIMGALAAFVAGKVAELPFIARFTTPRPVAVPGFLVPHSELNLETIDDKEPVSISR